MSMPRLMLWREKLAVRTGHFSVGGMSLRSSLTGMRPRMTHAGSAVIQTPDRSGLPLPSRGVGADRSTSPFAVRGAPGLGNLNHCAASVAEAASIPRVTARAISRVRGTCDVGVSDVMRPPLYHEGRAGRASLDTIPVIAERHGSQGVSCGAQWRSGRCKEMAMTMRSSVL